MRAVRCTSILADIPPYIEQVTGASCTRDCDTFNKYDSSLSTSYSKDGTSFTQSYEDGTEAKGILVVYLFAIKTKKQPLCGIEDLFVETHILHAVCDSSIARTAGFIFNMASSLFR